MPNKPLCIKVPGKLMIAGEFAVLEPNQKLVVMAVDRFVYATIEQSLENQLILENFNLKNLRWNHQYQKINIDSTDPRIDFVEQAMLIACDYLHEQSITPDPFTLRIKSELDDASGIKYGLGSSAAVVTAVITAILKKYLAEPPSTALIFKLAAISHVKTQGNGSGADIAASAYGGILQYASFQAEWLLDELKEMQTLTALVTKEWTCLSVKRVNLPADLSICIGWTGTPASTRDLVNGILGLKTENPQQFQQFLTDSAIAVDTILQGMETADVPRLLAGVKKNRLCLAMIGKQANVEIETPLLSELSNLAERFGGAGKPSGAGGGDCGIAFIPLQGKADQLQQAWENAGIKPLTINMYPFGPKAILIDHT